MLINVCREINFHNHYWMNNILRIPVSIKNDENNMFIRDYTRLTWQEMDVAWGHKFIYMYITLQQRIVFFRSHPPSLIKRKSFKKKMFRRAIGSGFKHLSSKSKVNSTVRSSSSFYLNRIANNTDDKSRSFSSSASYNVSSVDYMRGAVFWEENKPLTIEEFHLPRPKAGEVLIKTKACGVCHSDLHVMKGEIPFFSPCVVGHEITGEVVEHGPLTDAKTIQRFACLLFFNVLIELKFWSGCVILCALVPDFLLDLMLLELL